ncbi:hypothetical protein NY486_13625, partial [Enterobacter hormaechei]|nr:hypothetical protein [Enterobacter hormaechei]
MTVACIRASEDAVGAKRVDERLMEDGGVGALSVRSERLARELSEGGGDRRSERLPRDDSDEAADVVFRSPEATRFKLWLLVDRVIEEDATEADFDLCDPVGI